MIKKLSVFLNPKYIYALVFSSLAAWAIFAYITTTDIIKSQQSYARIINITGKQRMLSQKIALVANHYHETKGSNVKEELSLLYELMKSDHIYITQSHISSDETHAVYYSKPRQLDESVKKYFALIEKFINEETTEVLTRLTAYAFALLPQLDYAVTVFENESKEQIELLLGRELLILVGIIITLTLESIFIVIPAIRYTQMHEDKLVDMVKKRTSELEVLTITDQLTGIYNRRKIDETLAFEIERASRGKANLSVLMIDVDNFKNINDTYGHLRGDEVLKSITNILCQNTRKSDMLGRWGGEEFLILVNESDKHKVIDFAEKIRRTIEKYYFEEVGYITCSFGITRYLKDDTPASMIIRADIALYTAKDAGRNCIKYVSQ